MSLWFELVASGLITGGIYAVVAIGLNLQYGLMRILNISHGEFLMLGAYLTWLGYTVLQVNPLVFLPVVALGFSVAPVAGQNVGARLPRRVRQAFGSAVGMGSALMVLSTLGCNLFAEELFALFTEISVGDAP